MKSSALLLVWGLFCCSSIGCAALSLFDETHTHNHQHHYDCQTEEMLSRLNSLEQRVGMMETPMQPVAPRLQ